MKFFRLNIFIVAAIVAFANNYAIASGGVKGGQTIEINGKTTFRDIADKAVCTPIPMEYYLKKYPSMQKILGRLEAIHWYAALAYQREIKKLTVCETGARLKKISTDDDDTLMLPQDYKTFMVAIRLDNVVYLSLPEINKITAEADRAITMIHEINHSFIPDNVPRRNDSVRSFTKTLTLKYLDAEILASSIEVNSVNFPKYSAPFDSIHAELTLLNSSYDDLNLYDPNVIAASAKVFATLTDKNLWKKIPSYSDSKKVDLTDNGVPYNCFHDENGTHFGEITRVLVNGHGDFVLRWADVLSGFESKRDYSGALKFIEQSGGLDLAWKAYVLALRDLYKVTYVGDNMYRVQRDDPFLWLTQEVVKQDKLEILKGMISVERSNARDNRVNLYYTSRELIDQGYPTLTVLFDAIRYSKPDIVRWYVADVYVHMHEDDSKHQPRVDLTNLKNVTPMDFANWKLMAEPNNPDAQEVKRILIEKGLN